METPYIFNASFEYLVYGLINIQLKISRLITKKNGFVYKNCFLMKTDKYLLHFKSEQLFSFSIKLKYRIERLCDVFIGFERN